MANSVDATEGPLPLPPETTRALQILLQANEYATDCAVDIWQFAVEVSELLTAGMTRVDLRWLLSRQFAEHACETTMPGDIARQFRRLPLTSIPDGTCFVLTALGLTALRSTTSVVQYVQPSVETLTPESLPNPDSSDLIGPKVGPECPSPGTGNSQPKNDSVVIPTWNSDLRELRFQGDLVKKFRVPAANQEMILSVFQEEGWPRWIDDPLPPLADVPPKPRLRATIKSLNRSQFSPLLRFHVNHSGQVVTWEESIL